MKTSLLGALCVRVKSFCLLLWHLFCRYVLHRRPAPKHSSLFLVILREFIQKQIIEQSPAAATVKKYELYYANLHLFLKLRQQLDLPADQVKIPIMEKFKSWLHANLKSCSTSHSSRHIEFYQRALAYAVRMEYIPFSPLQVMETPRDRVKEVVHLEQSELDALMNKKFTAEIYQVVRDLYVFQASTGLSYGDLATYQYVVEPDGHEWIYNTRIKTGIEYYVPVFPHARAIHKHYNGQLPIITNAAYNRVLKEIAPMIEVKKKLTTHTARKTFATLKSAEGWTHEAIQRMLGQLSLKTTETHYLRPNRKRIEREYRELGAA